MGSREVVVWGVGRLLCGEKGGCCVGSREVVVWGVGRFLSGG